MVDVGASLRYSLLFILIYDVSATFGHGFGSFYPLIFAAKNKKITFISYTVFVLGCMVFSVVLFNLHTPLFFAILSLWLLWHYARQKVGWVHLSEKKAGPGKRFIDELMIYNVCLMPALIYLAHPDLLVKMILVEYNINIVALPVFFYQPFLVLFYAFSGWYLLDQIQQVIRTHTLNLGKYVIILSGWLCFYLPFVCFPESFNFWIPAAFVHTLSYICFTYRFSKNHKIFKAHKQNHGNSLLFFPLKNFGTYILSLSAMGLVITLIYFYGRPVLPAGVHYHFVIPLALSYFFAHFITDAFVWRNKIMRASEGAKPPAGGAKPRAGGTQSPAGEG